MWRGTVTSYYTKYPNAYCNSKSPDKKFYDGIIIKIIFCLEFPSNSLQQYTMGDASDNTTSNQRSSC
jgi:hypothetical protein